MVRAAALEWYYMVDNISRATSRCPASSGAWVLLAKIIDRNTASLYFAIYVSFALKAIVCAETYGREGG